MSEPFAIQLITGSAIGLGAGYLGSLMVLRRMSLVGDALSHVALPGIACALLIGINPFIGAFVALVAAVFGVWWLSRTTAVPTETAVGIFFTTALAVGLLITPEPELLEALFGDITSVSVSGMITTLVFVGLVVFIITRIRGVLILDILSKDLARVSQTSVARAELIFLLLVALIVALGLRIAGTLLTGALVIIPAAAARNTSSSLSRYSLLSALFGGVSACVGIYIASLISIPPGPLVILTGGFIFAATLPFHR